MTGRRRPASRLSPARSGADGGGSAAYNTRPARAEANVRAGGVDVAEAIGFVVVGLRRGYQAAREVAATAGARLVAVADLDVSRAREVAQELGCEWTAEYRDLLRRDDVQVVGAWTPSGAHAMVARDALSAGKHAVSTKPMETTVAKCDAMIDAARRRNLILAIDFGNRYRPEVR